MNRANVDSVSSIGRWDECPGLRREVEDATFVADREGRWSEVSDAACRLLGRPRQQLLGQPMHETLRPPQARPLPASPGAPTTASGPWQLRAADGSWVTVEVDECVLPDGRWQGTVRDQATRPVTCGAFQRTTGLLQLVADRLPAMIAFVDAQLRYRFANERYAAWFGRTRETLAGRLLEEVIGPDAMARALPHIAVVLGGRAERFDNHLVSVTGAPRWMEVLYEPVRDDGGAVIGFVKLLSDIDERKQRERRSRHRAAELAREVVDAQGESAAHAAQLAAVVQTAADAIVTVDQHGMIASWNPAAERMFGWSASEVIGRDLALVLPPPHRERHDEYLARYSATGQGQVVGGTREMQATRRDGTVFPIDLSVGEGRVENRRFFTWIIRDITERKELQARLAQAERLAAVGELAAGVAHEINNPINTVINSAQLIKDGDDPLALCDVILAEGQRIAAIVKDLLDFARGDSRPPQPTAVAEVVTRTLRLVNESFKSRGIVVQTFVGEELPPVLVVPEQLQQVVLNLLINAKDALTQLRRVEPVVTLTVAGDDRGLTLLVRDNGPGLPEHLGERIFEPFVTTKRAQGGTGLGLSVSRSIVERFGGRIDVTSQPGQGAEFRVWLPRASAADEGAGLVHGSE